MSGGLSGAEQDTWATYFSIGNDGLERARRLAGTKGVGSEQDRYGQYFRGPDDAAQRLKSTFKDAAGDIDNAAHRVAGKAKDAFQDASGSEQDRYGNYFKGSNHAAERADHAVIRTKDAFRGTTGAEQDRYGGHFDAASGKLTDKARRGLHSFEDAQYQRREAFDRTGTFSPSDRTANPLRTATVGILQSTILPSLSLHGGLAAIAYSVARYTGRLDVKDYLWPAAQVANAWYSAVGRHLLAGVSLTMIVETLSYPERILLGGITAWGTRLLYRIATRSIARGQDDERYIEAKKEPDFWNKAAFAIFLPEALFQTIISLPVVLPFRDGAASAALAPTAGLAHVAHFVAVFIFGTGFALETLADRQLATHKEKATESLNRGGVWSIVRHPNYLGETLIHASFPILLYSCGLLHPIAVLGPLANYAFLRYIGGDAQTETSQEERYKTEDPAKLAQLQQYKAKTNSFWPKVEELKNSWVWTVVGVGLVGAVVESGVRELLLH
ncbi:hypothetical protein EJ05DRAFT_441357 [Pseudovirgaria hyperparasitica]|uniref:Uncharacterized protein n=1 Tax=Pseudovirgaria hyperparasitica TaxID=470096 RepID=A0A6A6W0B1_9PEZI|nr:uncharacterized protein EJ05DRAFT_441357 [Pseudovirgaria hyperparasitica]KAF2756358.1 hypothetical protein EJ05DRAFT_441357 [Pseudovirgaria hyperparasitica]